MQHVLKIFKENKNIPYSSRVFPTSYRKKNFYLFIIVINKKAYTHQLFDTVLKKLLKKLNIISLEHLAI